MFFQWKLAYLNIWRRPIRTLSIIIMINFGIMGLLFTQGVYRGMIDQMLYDTIRTGTGHVSLYDKDYRQLKKIANKIEEPGKIIHYLKNDPMVDQYIQRQLQNGMISTARASRPVTIIGINPEKEKLFGQMHKYMEDGEFEIREEDNEIIIGSELAKKLKTKKGKKVVVQSQGKNGTLISAAFTIGGIIRTNNPSIDLSGIFLTVNQFNRFIGTFNQPHQISILLKNETDVPAFMDKMNAFLPEDVKAYSWKKLNPMASYMRDVVFQMESIIYAIIFILVAVAIFDIMLVSILERVREFGIMMAVGTPFSKIRNLIVFESAIVGLLGFLAGSATSLLMLLYLRKYGINLESAAGGLAKMGMATTIYANVKAWYFSMAFLATLTSTLIASIVPIIILKRLKPMQAIYFT